MCAICNEFNDAVSLARACAKHCYTVIFTMWSTVRGLDVLRYSLVLSVTSAPLIRLDSKENFGVNEAVAHFFASSIPPKVCVAHITLTLPFTRSMQRVAHLWRRRIYERIQACRCTSTYTHVNAQMGAHMHTDTRRHA